MVVKEKAAGPWLLVAQPPQQKREKSRLGRGCLGKETQPPAAAWEGGCWSGWWEGDARLLSLVPVLVVVAAGGTARGREERKKEEKEGEESGG